MPTEELIAERMPTWNALSELFLDDELTPADHQRIATTLAHSNYTEQELHAILRHEVYPVCSMNLVCVAGAWGTWGEDWIREHIAPKYDHRPKLHLPALLWSGIQPHWDAVIKSISEQRSKPEQDKQANAIPLHPMSFDPAYEDFLINHTDGNQVFEYKECHYRLKTREELFERLEIGRFKVPFISCLVAYRQRLQQCGYSEDEVAAIDGTAIGEYSGDIIFISHESESVCTHCTDGTANAVEIAPSVDAFLAGLKRAP